MSKTTASDIVRAVLRDKKMTQAQLAERIGRSASALSELLRRDMKFSNLHEILEGCEYEIIVRKKTPGGRTKKFISVDADGSLITEGFDTKG